MKTSRVMKKSRIKQLNVRRRNKRVTHLRSLASIEDKATAITQLQQLAGTANVIAAEKQH